MSEPSPPDVCRRFVEMAFERVGMSIWWEGPKGLGDYGIINSGSHVGKTVVTICSDFFRPIEVMPLGLDCRGGFGAHYPNAKGSDCGAKNCSLALPALWATFVHALVASFSMQSQGVQGEMVADTSKACTELGWQRTTSLRQLVNEMVDNDMALASTAV